MNILVVVNNSSLHLNRIEKALSLINGVQRFFRLTLQKTDFGPQGRFCNPAAHVAFAEKLFAGKLLIILVEQPLDDNWFSHEYRNSSIISLYDWEAHYAPPSLKAYILYQIAQSLVHFAADMSEEIAMNIVHEPPIGCIYDMAINKPDIKFGMLAGNICHRCVGQLRALGTAESAIDATVRILSIVRFESLGRPTVFEPEEIFVVMRFTHNDENDNAWRYGIMPAITSCRLRPTRGDDHVESMHILDKVHRAIRRSRLIVAKIDENNLNVYFELGLSMGLDKDVLLISEANLTINFRQTLGAGNV
ncbi:MAG: hypothetical protein U1E17_08095 [Geminicoccaceae bacterium]